MYVIVVVVVVVVLVLVGANWWSFNFAHFVGGATRRNSNIQFSLHVTRLMALLRTLQLIIIIVFAVVTHSLARLLLLASSRAAPLSTATLI